MKWLNTLLIIMALTFVSCSGNKKKAAEGKDGESVELDADFIVDSEDEDLMVDDEPSEGGEEMASSDDAGDDLGGDAPTISEAPDMDSGSNGTYTVKKGDTLMWIAFKIYGDYGKWADLSRQNGNIVSINEGQVLNYTEPAERFVWNPKGNPHTIVNGETLGTISNDKYGTPGKWRSIYDNNKPMIKDPNLIFAGFTLYYIPSRDLASEM